MDVFSKSEYDVIVVGSGPGGATVAKELACRGKKVLTLERGLGGAVRGTAKICEVVDANLKTRIDNLYVCDCSVMPEAWGLPPTLTLVALGKRLARPLVAGQHPVARPVAA
jgi:choline dehydrogenase-like flavoprotein